MRILTTKLLPLIAISAVAAFMFASGCGDKSLTLHIDLLSFMDSTLVTQTYGDNPVIPAGNPYVPILAPPQRVNLSEGLGDITDIESVSLRISSEFVNETGSADVLLEVFVTDTLESPYDAIPYISESLHVEPAATDSVHADIVGDEMLGELFTSEAVELGFRLTFDASSSPENVTGIENLLRFSATVIARRHISQ